jgi:hypothetical protein
MLIRLIDLSLAGAASVNKVSVVFPCAKPKFTNPGLLSVLMIERVADSLKTRLLF